MFWYTNLLHGPPLLVQKSGIYTFLNKFYGFTKWAALKFETCGRSKMAILGILVDFSGPDWFQSDLFWWYLWLLSGKNVGLWDFDGKLRHKFLMILWTNIITNLPELFCRLHGTLHWGGAYGYTHLKSSNSHCKAISTKYKYIINTL